MTFGARSQSSAQACGGALPVGALGSAAQVLAAPLKGSAPPEVGPTLAKAALMLGAAHYLVSGARIGSFAYATAAFALVTMTGASRNAGTIFTPLL